VPRSTRPTEWRRSGTYWLQRIVTAHPDVSEIPGETHLFSHGIAPLFERFHHDPGAAVRVGRIYADRDTLLDATREFCDRVLGEFLEPGDDRLSERTPLHVYHLGLISAIYPDARFVHIIRDGRDVARSLLAREWGPTTIAAAAEEWRSSVLAARQARPAQGYLEVRYEELLTDPESNVPEIYRHLGLETTEAIVDAALVEARSTSANVDPSDPRIAAGKWRDSWSASDRREFQEVAGEMLVELGYAAHGAELGGTEPAVTKLRRRAAAGLARLGPRRQRLRRGP
jgi:hypothetical protein